MTRRRRAAVLSTLSFLFLPALLQGQGRDSLLLGRRAYERADLDAAVRLLPPALAAAPSGDSLWVGGVHMLLDALLESGRDSLAGLWGRWAVRLHPAMRADSNLFPPRVARIIGGARREVAGAALDSLAAATTAYAPDPDAGAGRGALRLQRGGGADLAIVESVGTLLPGEIRTLPPGTYRVRIGFGPARAVVVVDVLPGFATLLTPRTPTARMIAAAPPAEPTSASAPAIRGSGLASAGAVTCAVLPAGALYCWGDNRQGQLGRGSMDSVRGLQLVPIDGPVTAVGVGTAHACGLTRGARAFCWGQGAGGAPGGGRAMAAAGPVAVTGGAPFAAITGGGAHTCALSTAGAAFCWGANRAGELGTRAGAPSAVPVSVAAPAGVVFTAIAAGSSHTCALASNGAGYCWGANDDGQLGTGTTSGANQPAAVLAPGPLRDISAGGTHTCALAATGSAWCWGANASGQTGSGGAGTSPVTRPVAVAGGLTFASIASGEAHSCGLTTDGAAYCWGAGRTGQLGNAQLADSPRPVLVVGGHVFRALALGVAHSCAVTTAGTVWCWGDNSAGQLGALGGRQSAVPVPVLVRPAPRAAGTSAPARLRESFADGNYSAAPAWQADSARGTRLAVRDGALEVARADTRGHVAGVGLSLPVRIPVGRETAIQFDVLVQAGFMGCGLNCAEWPAAVRVRTRNSDLSETEIWFAYGTGGGAGTTLGGVTIAARGDLAAGEWLRGQRFVVRDHLPRADTIIQISLGGLGADFSARFDNIVLPVPEPRAMAIQPASPPPMRPGAAVQLTAAARDASDEPMPWVAVAWSSGDTLVARVDAAGLLTAVRAGRTWIRAAAGPLADSVQITVTPPPRPGPTRRPGRPPR